MRRNEVILLLGLCLCSLSASAQPMALTGNDSRPPKTFLRDGQPKGILIDIMKYLHEETGTFTQQLAMMAAGRLAVAPWRPLN